MGGVEAAGMSGFRNGVCGAVYGGKLSACAGRFLLFGGGESRAGKAGAGESGGARYGYGGPRGGGSGAGVDAEGMIEFE